MKIKLIIFLLFGTTYSYSQSNNYSNDSLFKGEAVIFTEDYIPPFKVSGKIYTPTSTQILEAENILFSRYNKDLEDIAWKEENARRKYWCYNRQYLAYIDLSGENIMIINLLNFKRKKKAVKGFEGWKEIYLVGFGEYYEKNTVRFEINLDTRKLSLQ